MDVPVAIITGGSRGLGRALTHALVRRGWHVITDSRRPDPLLRLRDTVGEGVTTINGDVADPEHRRALVDEARRRGRLDALVNNASTLGPTPLSPLADLTAEALARVLETNVVAPQALTRDAIDLLRDRHGVLINITSDAAVEPYETWGGYGASKAGLEQLTRILAAEEPDLRIYTVDPGDMRTDMHQAAFPDEDISDRPLPEDSVPGIVTLLEDRSKPSGRYLAREAVSA